MSRESYALRPATVETFALNDGTDIILRKNIEKVTKQPEEEGGKPYTVWECDELQCRTKEEVTTAEVEADFDTWWVYAESYKAEEMNADTEKENVPAESGVTVSDRLDAIEAAINEIAEVIANG